MKVHKHYKQSPVEIIQTKLGIPQDYKQKCIKEIYRLGDSQDQQTNVKAIMTTYRIWEESKVFNPLLDRINDVFDTLELTNDKHLDIMLGNVWGAIYKKDHYTVKHNHSPSLYSFVYYLKTTNNTPLVFDDCNFSINPTDDDIIIFPGHLNHGVPKHDNNEDRVCIAGNYMVPLNDLEKQQLFY